ncbi:hypothetical protein HT134_25165 [Nonomuraea rhodomycinica]|uniref:Uncharacterized protein n=1 Tax=Nonomuraea rhodomycinica TaxID=1712872 RepID=A0A7Y6MD22_9ACTN|nr:hypothetical protein [Nonomuraea rhodomycinica]
MRTEGRQLRLVERTGVDPVMTSFTDRSDERMVPEGPVEVLVCGIDGSGRPPRRLEHGTEQARDLAAALNAPAAEPGGDTLPALRNELLPADLDDDVRDRLARLAPPQPIK